MSVARMRWFSVARIFVAFGLAVGMAACGTEDSGNPPPPSTPVVSGESQQTDGGTSGTESGAGTASLTLEVPSPARVTAGGSGIQVTATLTGADGQPAQGETVSFRLSPSSIGTLSASTATSDASGKASVTFQGTQAGTATITAVWGSLTQSVSVTVEAPTIEVSTSADTITASDTSGTGATVTFTVKDHAGSPLEGLTVTFATTLGDLDATTRKTDSNGQAQVKLTSEKVGTALVTATVQGTTSDAAQIQVVAGDLATLTLTSDTDRIPTTGKVTLAVQASDAFGNPVDATVTFSAKLDDTGASTGSFSPASVDLVDGKGETTFTPTEEGLVRITAQADGVEKSLDISVEASNQGEPSQIQFQVSSQEITVQGGGGTETSTITIDVLDVDGNPIEDQPNNLEIVISEGPRAGENLDGDWELGETRTLSTQNGSASVTLHSGTRPGTVLIEVRVTKDSQGNDLASPLTATVPAITIRSGAPASLFLTRANAIQSPGLRGQGTITHNYLAFVSDRWGNAVPDGTAVYFSAFLDVVLECRNTSVFDKTSGYKEVSCSDGELQKSSDPSDVRATFTSASKDFEAAGVSPGDILVILTESNPYGFGGYRVDEVVDAHTLKLESDVPASATGLQWAIGNNAVSGGGVFTTEGQSSTEGGVATWPFTYAGELVNRPVYVYAEAEGGTQGHGRYFHLSWLADTQIVQLSGPENGDEVAESTEYTFVFWFTDSSSPSAYAIPDLDVTVTATAGTLGPDDPDDNVYAADTTELWALTSSRSAVADVSGGILRFKWTSPGVSAQTDVTLWIAGGGVSTKLKLTVVP